MVLVGEVCAIPAAQELSSARSTVESVENRRSVMESAFPGLDGVFERRCHFPQLYTTLDEIALGSEPYTDWDVQDWQKIIKVSANQGPQIHLAISHPNHRYPSDRAATE